MVKNQKGVWYLNTVYWCPVCGREEWEIKRQSAETPNPGFVKTTGGFPKFHRSVQSYCGCMNYELYGI